MSEMNIKFSQIANSITKDNKISEEEAKKANDLGLAFVIAGMNENEFEQQVQAHQNQVQTYINNTKASAFIKGVKKALEDTFNNGIEAIKSGFGLIKQRPNDMTEGVKEATLGPTMIKDGGRFSKSRTE